MDDTSHGARIPVYCSATAVPAGMPPSYITPPRLLQRHSRARRLDPTLALALALTPIPLDANPNPNPTLPYP